MEIKLTNEEALVLFEFLSRFSEQDILGIEDQAEMRVLWNLQSLLEKLLPESFLKDYEIILNKARSQIRDDGDFTNAENEKMKGKLSLWLEPKLIEFIANEWRKIPENASEPVKEQWSAIVFRAMAALHKAGISYEPKFPKNGESYKHET
jgi:hypothetical protein